MMFRVVPPLRTVATHWSQRHSTLAPSAWAAALMWLTKYGRSPGRSHLVSADGLRAALEAAGFAIGHWADLTDQAGAVMQAVLSRPPAPLGLHAFVPGFAAKATNLTRGLASGHLRVIQAIALASGTPGA